MKTMTASSSSNALVLLPKTPQKRKMKAHSKPSKYTTDMVVRKNLRSNAAYLREYAKMIIWLTIAVETILCFLNAYAKDIALALLGGSAIDTFCGWLPIIICTVAYLVGCGCFAAVSVLYNMADALMEDSKRLARG